MIWTAILVSGLALIVIGLGLAWPPLAIIFIGLLNCSVWYDHALEIKKQEKGKNSAI